MNHERSAESVGKFMSAANRAKISQRKNVSGETLFGSELYENSLPNAWRGISHLLPRQTEKELKDLFCRPRYFPNE